MLGLLVVINDCDIESVTFQEGETDAPPVIDADAPLVCPISTQCLETIGRRQTQVFHFNRCRKLHQTPSGIANQINDPVTVMNAMASAQAAAMANSSYRTMATMAKETLPLIHNVVQLIILGIFPILILLMVLAGGRAGKVLMSYVLVMLWVQLWAPLYAIVNYVATLRGFRSMQAVLNGVDGLSIVNASPLYNTTIEAEAVAGMLTIAVPIIALAIVKGGEVAMSGVTERLTAPANQAASQAGSSAGLGNVNQGNIQWGTVTANNTSANKYDTAGTFNANTWTETNAFGTRTVDVPSGRTTGVTSTKTNMPVSVTGEQAQMLTNAENNSERVALNISKAAQSVDSKMASLSKDDRAAVTRAYKDAFNESGGIKYDETQSLGWNLARLAQHMQQVSSTASTSASAKVGTPGGKENVASAGANVSQTGDTTESQTSQENMSTEEALRAAVGSIYQATRGIEDSKTRQTVDGLTKTFQQALTANKIDTTSVNKEKAAGEQTTLSNSSGVKTTEDYNHMVYQRIADKHYGGESGWGLMLRSSTATVPSANSS
jgi:conjugal transfer mating pair stabilization protein TraG